MSQKKKSNFIIYLEYIPCLVLAKTAQILPHKCCLLISSFIFKLLFIVDKKHRNRAISHLMHAKVAKNREEAVKIAKKSYNEFSKLIIEILRKDKDYSQEKIQLLGSPETLKMFSKESKEPMIVISAHYGNWEIAANTFCDKTGREVVSVMRPFDNPLVGEIILKSRRSDKHTIVPKDISGIQTLMKSLLKKKIITILIDQHAVIKESVETTFFGQPCRTHKTPALFHLKTGIPIYPVIARRKSENFEIEIFLGEPIVHTPTGDKEKDAQIIMQRCNDALEEMISEKPEQWLWVHRRWTNINR